MQSQCLYTRPGQPTAGCVCTWPVSVLPMNKSIAAINTATLSLTIDYCGGKLKYWLNLNPHQMPSVKRLPPSDAPGHLPLQSKAP